MPASNFNRLTISFRRMGAQIRKELDWFTHDRLSITILYLLPIFLVITIAAGDFTITDLAGEPVVYIIDEEQSEYSIAFINAYKITDEFSMEIHDNNAEPEWITLENCTESINNGLIDAYVIIPAHFSENLIQNRSTEVILVLNANSEMAGVVSTYFNSGSMLFQGEFLIFNSEIVYEPEMRPDENFDFLIMVLPILISLVLFICTNLVASQCIVADDPLKRMLLTPARRSEIIFAKSFAYIFLGALLSFICIFILQVIFQVGFTSFLNALVISFISTIFGVLYGILFSSISTTRLQAAQMSLFFFVIQFTFGIFIRIEPIVSYLPYEIVRKNFTMVAFRGIGLSSLPGVILEIVIHIFIILTLSIILYKNKKFAV